MSDSDDVIVPTWLDVSRETLAALKQFVALVLKWNPAVNLVSRRSVPQIWDRHVFDSAQLFSMVPQNSKRLVDLGSGGGFPGVVLAIMAKDALPDLTVTLVEADQRKATFLSEALRHLSLPGKVTAQRIEAVEPQHADVITARALAPMVALCGHLHRHLEPSGVALILKGAGVDAELAETRPVWTFSMAQSVSKTDAQAKILAIKDLRHV